MDTEKEKERVYIGKQKLTTPKRLARLVPEALKIVEDIVHGEKVDFNDKRIALCKWLIELDLKKSTKKPDSYEEMLDGQSS